MTFEALESPRKEGVDGRVGFEEEEEADIEKQLLRDYTKDTSAGIWGQRLDKSSFSSSAVIRSLALGTLG